MAENVLIEELGPRGRRRVLIGTVVAVGLFAVAVVWMILRLDEHRQLEADRWTWVLEWANARFLLEGVAATVRAALVAGAIALLFGFAFALLRLAKSRIVRSLAITYIEWFRALPLLLMIFGIFALDTTYARSTGDALLGRFGSVVLALVLYNSAVFAEIFRAGVLSLDRGQTEAAQSVGMSYWQAMFIVILPQAVRRMVPAIVAQLATLMKDVSLGFVIGYDEFVARGKGATNFTEARNLQSYLIVGVVYFLLVYLVAKFADFLESRQRRAKKVAPTDATMVEVAMMDDVTIGPDHQRTPG